MQRVFASLLLLGLLASCGVPSLGVITCSSQAKTFLSQSQALMTEWNDVNKVAAATGRFGLAPLVSQMQDIRRRVDALDTPECASYARAALSLYMDQTVNATLSFMQNQSDSFVQSQFAQASGALRLFDDELARITNDGQLPKTREPVATAAARLQPTTVIPATPEPIPTLNLTAFWATATAERSTLAAKLARP